MEYGGDMTLLKYLKNHPKNKISESSCKKVFKALVNSINYLHSKGIAHRDLKLENVMMDRENIIKLIDFGFAIKSTEKNKITIFCGTPKYMAPEIVSKKSYMPFPVDIWALGVLLYILIVGKFPFFGYDEKDLFVNIKKLKYLAPSDTNPAIIDIIQRIFTTIPENRPSAKSVKCFKSDFIFSLFE